MVIENPYSGQHYLTRYWPIKPALVDGNRHELGDFCKKPTQYWFIGFEPRHNAYMYEENFNPVLSCSYDKGGKNRTVNRSIISSTYARRFILMHILPRQEDLLII